MREFHSVWRLVTLNMSSNWQCKLLWTEIFTLLQDGCYNADNYITAVGKNEIRNVTVFVTRDVKQSSNFGTLVLKFEFDLHTFSIRISD